MNYTIVGIDFGTSTTVVRVKNYVEGGESQLDQPLMFDDVSCLPTLIFEDGSGNLYCGHEAKAQVDIGAEGVLHKNFKMDLIGDSGKKDKAQHLIEEFFKYIYSNFDKQRSFLNVFPDVKTYVSYPAKWTTEEIGFMKRCAIGAGFGTKSKVFGETEPTAAIFASIVMRLEDLQKEKIIARNNPVNAMMLDMGAGTSDIAIFKFSINDDNKIIIGDQMITYPTIDDKYLCGGREIDELLFKYLSGLIECPDESVKNSLIGLLKENVRSWKEGHLSKALESDKKIDSPIAPMLSKTIALYKPIGIRVDLSEDNFDRKKFEKLTRSHWKQLHSLIIGAVEEAKNKLVDFNGVEDIDLVVLTGGHSQWYGVRELIEGKAFAGLKPIIFSKIKIQQKPEQRILQEERPRETVAKGLVYSDIDIELMPAMRNSLWLQYEIDGIESEKFHVAELHEVLPIPNEKNKGVLDWETSVRSTYLTDKTINITCKCYYGRSLKTAICKQTEHKLQLNGNFDMFCKKMGDAVVKFISLDWSNIGKDNEEQDYSVRILSRVKISEYNAISIKGIILKGYDDSDFDDYDCDEFDFKKLIDIFGEHPNFELNL